MGAKEAITPGRVRDAEGAGTIVLSYKRAASAIAAIVKNKFQMVK